MTPLLALAIFLAIMGRAEHIFSLGLTSTTGQAQTVGVLSIVGAILALMILVG